MEAKKGKDMDDDNNNDDDNDDARCKMANY